MRALVGPVAVLLLATVLGGCLESQRPVETDDVGLPDEEPVFEPVRVDLREDLSEGFAQESWTFDVGTDARGHIHFAIESDLPEVSLAHDYCFQYQVEKQTPNGTSSESGSQCRDGGSSISIGVGGAAVQELWDDARLAPGTYHFAFRAGSQMATFVADVAVEYA